MAKVLDFSESQLKLSISDRGSDEFQVTRYSGTEALSQLFRFEIELSTRDIGMDHSEYVGLSACLTINTANEPRNFNGIIGRFEVTGETTDLTFCRVEVVPAVWLLTHRYQSRIFQNKDVKAIISDVMEKAGIVSDTIDMSRLTRTYTAREYCVQYRETDFCFISRLMEEEGIWYFFEHTAEKHVMVLCENKSNYKPIPGGATLPYRPPTGLTNTTEHVYRFRRSQQVRPGVVALNDFSFKKPKLGLDVKSDLGRDPGLFFQDFPGEYSQQSEGTTIATMRTEEFECNRITATGMSSCGRFSPGLTFMLEEHPTPSLNGEYLLTSVTHRGKQAVGRTSTSEANRGRLFNVSIHQELVRARQDASPSIKALAEALLLVGSKSGGGDPTAMRSLTYWLYHAGQVVTNAAMIAMAQGGNPLDAVSRRNLISDGDQSEWVDDDASIHQCLFECIPSTASYRPPRVTPWPVMRGAQTARVVGPSGEEIHCDAYGRVRVQFNWDRQGSEGGTAKLFGSDSSCWIRVSQGMAGGQYGMMFLPRVGQEVVVDFLEGDPDQPIIVGRVYNDDHKPPYALPEHKTRSVIKTNTTTGGGGTNEIRFEDAKGKEQILIHGHADLHIRVGHQERHFVKENQYLIIEGEQREKIKKSRSISVDGADALKVGDKQGIEVVADANHKYGANLGIEVASDFNIKAGKVLVSADTICLSAGGNFVLIDSSGVTIKGSQVKINSGGSATAATVTAPAAPAEPEEADAAQPGADVSYTGEKKEIPKIEPKPSPGHWISIDLKDEEDKPVAGEAYEITTPSGSVRKGTTDVNGFAKEWIEEAGECQITFPNLDESEWQSG